VEKVRPWREKKIANVDYFELLHILEFKKAEKSKKIVVLLQSKKYS
jgi:plasmid rolling circle replication initiator protein Rep